MIGRYILDGHTPVEEPDLYKWGRWLEKRGARRVEETMIDKVRVSTVFLGLDHSFGADGPPLLFETMSFGKRPFDQEQTRCSTWDEAVLMHHAMCERVRDYKAGRFRDEL